MISVTEPLGFFSPVSHMASPIRFNGTENLKGRPKGVPNRVTLAAQRFAQAIVESAEYRESIRRRIRNDNLQGTVETTLLHYAWGKPKETVVLERPIVEDLRDESEEALAQRAARLAREVLEPLPDVPALPPAEDGVVVIDGRVKVEGYDYLSIPMAEPSPEGGQE